MARWKLTEAAYLLLEEETRWEYVEVERVTGRPKRTQFIVPRYLQPLDPADWTETRIKNEDGDIILSNGNNPGRGDLIFKGNPIPGMLPLDDEAKQISSKYDWKPTQGLDMESQAESHTNKLLNGLIEQMAQAQAGTKEVAASSQVSEVLSAMGKMMEQNQQILMALIANGQNKPQEVGRRR